MGNEAFNRRLDQNHRPVYVLSPKSKNSGRGSLAQFINSRESLVTESIDGLLRSSGGANLARLDGYPGIKVVIRTDHKPSRVALVSGGGSGHEPAHAGFVGKGMLTAAVCGDVFASPSVDAVLAGILAVTGKGGCLLIVKNYTGDRLNFGLAAERARAMGLKVEMVVVADDIALPNLPQPRGVAGTLFVHKIAGHYAEKGASLAQVAAIARKAAQAAASLGVSLGSCTIPGAGKEDRVPKGKAELGLGIHGEPGVELIDFGGAGETATTLSRLLFEKAKPARSYAMLVNNLGSTTPLELGVITNEILASKHGGKIKLVIGPAPLMTSLDMHGISVSLLPLSAEFETALKSPVAPSAWPGARLAAKPKIVKLPKAVKAARVKASRNDALRDILNAACRKLIDSEATLNALDAKVGDGDTGSTIAAGARNILDNLNQMPLGKLDQAFNAISAQLTRSMGGSSGVLLAILFAAAARAAQEGQSWQKSLQTGLHRMMEYGGAKAGHRTMVDALEPALAVLAGGQSVSAAAKAAVAGAEATARMTRAKAGRSSYVSSSNLEGIVDPGAAAVAMLFAAFRTAD